MAEPTGRPPLVEALRYAQIGTMLVAPMLLLGGLGFLLDRRLDTGPWLLLAGLVLGMAMGFLSFFRLVLSPPGGDPPARPRGGSAVVARHLVAALAIGAAAVAAGWSLRGRLSPAVFQGGILGAVLATAGAVAGLLTTAWAFDKEARRFFAALIAGILGRLLLYGAVLVYVALRTAIDPVATAASLLAFYVLFQVLEVRFAMRGLGRSQG